MTNGPGPRLSRAALIAVALTFIVGVAASRPAAAQTCDKLTDAQITATIYARINGDKALALQVSHINVGVLYQVVKLQGWANTQRDLDKVVEFANVSCVRMINKNEITAAPPPADSSQRSGGGCSSGMKACGDICIPSGDVCSIVAVAP
jgi:hypothetical protein